MNNRNTAGVIYAIAAYLVWGILPIYWKLLDNVFPMEVLAHRIVWSLVFMCIVITVTKQWDEFKHIIKDKRQMLYIFIASIMITINYGVYIWAINSNKIIEASLGYYINPLLAVLLGIIIFKEKVNFLTGTALIVALVGVLIKAIQYGKIPWISLSLAVSFALYGAIKKSVSVSPTVGITLEVAMITPFALIYIGLRNISGVGAFNTQGASIIFLLMGSGVATAVPLLLFASGAKRIPLSLIGFTQYICPTIVLLIGIFMYNEGFTTIDMIAFGFIWLAIVIYSFSQVSLRKNLKSLENINKIS
ncbi:chloramphenicol-sensitive protein RarD [Clostridium acidisoli DSM 12555]|uniref:Chloramphenicol-sensitive protein RarD n=1 Tax=Clostridium acidisoli DSM 12555 TaxID=1121291 RepID=A0A1W1XHT6_9CLOT|nr:EamA family transporter RarD [Clostridium acidisoli]SMC23397.1 chloramphenicol-sensitive protein RarD [Clostridium acidisoli DSM 12555]